MAQKVTVELVDDIDGTYAEGTTAFGLDGVDYEIDLSAENHERLCGLLEDYIENARRVGGKRKTKTKAKAEPAPAASQPARPTAKVDREQTKAMRVWAQKNGYGVGDRGRIPADVIAAYHASSAA